MKVLKTIAFAITMMQLTGCATMINGRHQQVDIDSTPTGANVLIDGKDIGLTPTTATLKRNKNHGLRLTKDGYHDEHRELKSEISGAVAGNIIAGGFIGWGVDAMTGAQYKIVPNNVHVQLKKDLSKTSTTSKSTEESAEKSVDSSVK
jgi:hypothetical protein